MIFKHGNGSFEGHWSILDETGEINKSFKMENNVRWKEFNGLLDFKVSCRFFMIEPKNATQYYHMKILKHGHLRDGDTAPCTDIRIKPRESKRVCTEDTGVEGYML